MTGPLTATSSASARSSAPSTTASTRSRRSTGSATATRDAEPASQATGGTIMPDASGALPQPAVSAASWVQRERWVSPLLQRILLVNALPLVLLVAALLYLDQYQNGLLEAEVLTLREQARIYAGALGQSAVNVSERD